MSKLAESLLNQGLIGQEEAKIADASAYEDGAGGTFTDADTIKRDGITYRLAGFDAREVDKFNEDGTPRSFSGDLGGAEQTIAVADLARKHGYTILQPVGDEPDPYGRTVAELVNADGEKFSERLIKSGIIKPQGGGFFGSQDLARQTSFADLAKQSRAAQGIGSDWDEAAAWIDESIAEQSRYLPQFKQLALNERQLAEAKHAAEATYNDPNATAEEKAIAKRNYEQFSTAGVQLRDPSRNLNNTARNPLSESWDIGVRGALEGATGMLELIGHELGWEELENWAAGSLDSQRYELANAPKVLTDFRDIDGIGSFLEYTGNMAAMSLPYMALTIGAAIAAPATGGLSFTAPASVYAGQVWNEMGDTEDTDKNAALAISAGIAMATLDRIGLSYLTNSSLLTKGGQRKVIQEMVKSGRYASEEAAEQALVQIVKREGAKFAGDVTLASKELLNKKNITRTILQNYGTGAIGEGITEVGQEAIAGLAAHIGSGKTAGEFDWDDFNERLQHAAVGGAVLGGAFTAPGTAWDVGRTVDTLHRQLPADLSRQDRQSRWREQEIEETGRLKSIPELAQEAAERASKQTKVVDIQERADADTKRQRSWAERRREGLEAVPGLWRGITRHIFSDELQDQSRAARVLADMFGGNHQPIHSGASYETAKHLQLAEYVNLVDSTGKLMRDFGYEGQGVGKAKEALSKKLYAAYEIAADKDGNVDWDKLDGTEYAQDKQLIKAFADKLQAMTDKMWRDQTAYNPELGRLKNYGFRTRALDKVAIEKNRNKFVSELQSRFKVSESDAQALTDAILNQNDVSTIDEAFSLTKHGGFKPTAHHERTLNLADDAEFANEWMSNDIFQNISAAARSAARYKTYQEYIGQDNSRVNQLFQEMEQELVAGGMDPLEARDRVNAKARQFRDYLDAESGNYKRPTTQLGRSLESIQRNIMTWTTLAGLPLATLSSLVEFALVFRGLTPGQISSMSGLAKEFTESFVTDFRQVDPGTEARKTLQETGFYEWDVGAATVTGATETKQSSKRMLDMFFTAIGLKQWTDFTRAARASFAMDFIMAKMNEINTDADYQTNEVLAAREGLSNLGINLPRFQELWAKNELGPLNQDESAEMQEMIRLATFNWVNDAIVLPQSANRPLFYQDPRFALVHTVPRLYLYLHCKPFA